MAKALFMAESIECGAAVRHGTAVAPYDGVAQRLQIFVDAYKTMHLIGKTDGGDVLRINMGFCHNRSCSLLEILPPAVRVLLRPSRMQRLYGCFLFREEI